MQRSLAAWYFAIFSLTDRRGEEKFLQLEDHLIGWYLAVKELEEEALDGMISPRMIDQFGMLMLGAGFFKNQASGCPQNAFQIADQQCRVKVLPNRLGGLAAEIFQIQAALHHVIKRFVVPTPTVDLLKFLGGIALFIQ